MRRGSFSSLRSRTHIMELRFAFGATMHTKTLKSKNWHKKMFVMNEETWSRSSSIRPRTHILVIRFTVDAMRNSKTLKVRIKRKGLS